MTYYKQVSFCQKNEYQLFAVIFVDSFGIVI